MNTPEEQPKDETEIEDQEKGESPEEAEEPQAEPSKVSLPGGDALTTDSAAHITQASATPVIVLAGPVSSGKTTLLASVYERFLRGPFAGFFFAGSETLVGLEDRCYLARVASGAQDPQTQRTEQSLGTHLFHLRVRRTDLSVPAIDVLFADMSGEHYKRALNSAADCRALSILKRADCLVLLVDGARLVAPKEQQACLQETRQLLRRCIEERMVGRHTNIHVLDTKWDEVRAAGLEKQLNAILTAFEKTLRESIPMEAVRSMSFFKVAASPKKEASLGVGYGLDTVFVGWLDSLKPSEPKRLDLAKGQRDVQRECDRFLALGVKH